MRIYYELMVWEEVDEYDTEILKNRSQEFSKRLNGFGILSFNMKASPPAQQVQQPQEQEVEMTAQEAEDEKILQEEEARLAQGQQQAPPQAPPQAPQQAPPEPRQQPGEILDE